MSQREQGTSAGCRALITGASAGIGRDFARLFAADGHDLVLVARRTDRLEQLAGELQAQHGVESLVVTADLADKDAPERIVARLSDEGVRVDHLVNNAGFGAIGRFFKLDGARQMDMIQVNVVALAHLTHLLLPQMLERRFGRVLNVASTAGFQPGPGMAVYWATKAFVISFSEALSYELKNTGVTATCLCPGATASEFGEISGNAESKLFKGVVASSEQVARYGYRAMKQGKALAIEGSMNWIGVQSLRVSPRALVRQVAAWINSRG